MDPISFLGKDILCVLGNFRNSEDIVEYSKVENDEFLKLPERGFYLHSKNGNGIIFDCRIYFEKSGEYFSAAADVRGKFASITTIMDLENILGVPTREIRSIQIPTRPPTLPGKEFPDGAYIIKAFLEDGKRIAYLHICKSDWH